MKSITGLIIDLSNDSLNKHSQCNHIFHRFLYGNPTSPVANPNGIPNQTDIELRIEMEEVKEISPIYIFPSIIYLTNNIAELVIPMVIFSQ